MVRNMYCERLKEFRLEQKLLQRDFAKILNISEITYTHYESEYYIMPLKYLINICDYFELSLDYIFGFKDINDDYSFKSTSEKIAGERLKNWRKEKHITQEKLASVLNTNRSVLANYERGRTLISTPFLYTICKKYKISADYLLGRIDDSK